MDKPGKQDQAIYSSEAVLRNILDDASSGIPAFHGYGSTWNIPMERKFGEVTQVEVYVNRVLKLNQVRNKYGALGNVQVKEIPPNENGEYKIRGHYRNGVIHLSPHGGGISRQMREYYVLHELAHHLVAPYGGHDTRFVEAFLDLISIAMDEQLAYLFRIILMEGGAKINV